MTADKLHEGSATLEPTTGQNHCRERVTDQSTPGAKIALFHALFRGLNIEPVLRDERFGGAALKVSFQGQLRPEQCAAAAALLAHDTGVLSATTAFGKTVIAVREGRSPLVLTERTEHLQALAQRLKPTAGQVITLQGGMGRKELRDVLACLHDLPAREGRVVLATGPYIGEGFDDPRLDTLFLTLPVSWRGTIAQ